LRDVATGKFVREFTVKNADRPVVAENCLCVRRRTYRAQLAAIPPAFRKPKLSRLKPRTDLHSSQSSAIEFVKKNPGDSYLLVGRNGTGKSHIAWALYRFALASRRPAGAVTVRDLLDEFRRMELSMAEGDLWTPRVRAVDLRKQGKRWFLFLDEFEKARPSEFASEQLFNLLDAARDFNHQLVITSNFHIDELRAHWGRINPVWANSIMTRLQACREIDFF
jgi:DNA replication protein DnaC